MQINKKIIICTLLILTIFSIIGGVNASDSLNETPIIQKTHTAYNSISDSQSPLSDTNINPQEDSVSDNNQKNKNTKIKEDNVNDKLKINQEKETKLSDSEPTTIYVAHNGTNDKDGKTKGTATSLSNALTISENGTTLHLITGIYTPGDLDSIYDKTINITGEDGVILDGDNRNRIFYFGDTCEVTLKNIIMINGYTPQSTEESGALIGNAGKLTIINCIFKDSRSEKNGGAIYNVGNLIVINSTFNNNYAEKNGGAIFNQNGGIGVTPYLTIDNCVFKNNTAKGMSQYSGGAIYIQNLNFINITNSLFENNKAIDYGGGAIEFAQSSNVYINNCSFINNSANGNINEYTNYGGGALSFKGYMGNQITNLNIENSLFLGNSVENNYGGGAIYATYATVNIKNSVLINNTDKTKGYAIFLRKGTYPNEAKITANDNWWGSNDKPTSQTNGATINRWLILTIHNETEIKEGETAKIVVSLNNYTTGTTNGTLTNPITVSRPVEVYTNLGNIDGKLVNGEFRTDYLVPSGLKIISTKVDSEEQVLFVITIGTELELTNITGHMGNRLEYSVKVKNNYTPINKGYVEIYFDDDLIKSITVINSEAKDTLIINKNIGNYTITAKFIDPTKEFEENIKTAKLCVDGVDNIVNTETFTNFFDNNILQSDIPFDEIIFEGTINDKLLTINKQIKLTGHNALFNNTALKLLANNIKVDNITFTANKILSDPNAIIHSEGENTVIENSRITYMAPKTDSSYVFYLDCSSKSLIQNNNITYTAYYADEIQTIPVYAINSDELSITNNNFNIRIPSVSIIYDNQDEGIANSAGLVIKNSEKINLNKNNISIQYTDYDEFQDTINGIHIKSSNNAKIINNNLELKGHTHSYPIWVDGSQNVEILNNNLLGESDERQTNTISVNGKSSVNIENNNITAKAPKGVYLIYLNDNKNYVATATVKNNNIKGYSNTVYGIYAEEAKTIISNNNLELKGNYTMGIVSHKTNIIITDNTINSNASNTGYILLPQGSMDIETLAICTSNSEIEIKNNKLKSTGNYTINPIKSTGTIESNQLIAKTNTGDMTIKNNPESTLEIKDNTNIINPENINKFLDDKNTLKPTIFDELIFIGTFNNLTITINNTIKLTGQNALFNNTNLNIIADNVKITNITFLADKIIKDTNAIIYIVADNTVIQNNTLTYNAPNTDDSYILYSNHANGLTIQNNNLNYSVKLGNNINTTVIYVNDSKNINIKDNDITSNSDKTIRLTNTTGTIKNNKLNANNSSGDETISQTNSNVIIDNDKSKPQDEPKSKEPNKTDTQSTQENKQTQESSTSINQKTSKKTKTPKQPIVAKNLKVKKSAKVLKIKVKLKKLNKKILKNKKVKLRFKGKTYTAKTNKKGIAIFKIPKKVLKKLKIGKTYKYTINYRKYQIIKKITVKK